MEEDKKEIIMFNEILMQEMGRKFELTPLPLDPEFKMKYADKKDKSVYIKSEHLACPKLSGIRTGELDLNGAMLIQFANIMPAKDYDIPILGYTFVYANKCLIIVLDLLPVSRDDEYMKKYILPLKDVKEKYAFIPRVEGSREEVADYAQKYDSGYSIYKWCDKEYMQNMEEAFRDYVRVFCDCINIAEPITDPEIRANRDSLINQYLNDYIEKDVGGAPLRSHFGKEWGESYMKDFFFGPGS